MQTIIFKIKSCKYDYKNIFLVKVGSFGKTLTENNQLTGENTAVLCKSKPRAVSKQKRNSVSGVQTNRQRGFCAQNLHKALSFLFKRNGKKMSAQ